MGFRSSDPGWLGPILLDGSVIAFTASFTRPGGAATYDVRNYPSIHLRLDPGGSGVSDDQQIELTWYRNADASGPILGSRVFDVRGGSGTDSGVIDVVVPNLGPFLTLAVGVNGFDASSCTLLVHGTHQAPGRPVLKSPGPLLVLTDVSINSGVALTTFFPWYAGPATINVRTRAQTGEFAVVAFDAFGVQQLVWVHLLGANAADTFEVLIPPKIGRFDIYNSGGAAGLFSVAILPDHLKG